MEHTLGAVGQIHISVDDLEAAVDFYRDVLGLTHLFSVPGQPMAFFDAGGVRLYLGVPEDARFRSRPILYHQVEDLEATYEAVVGRGATSVSRPRLVHRDGSGELWMAFVASPDGLPIGMMAQRPTETVATPDVA